MPNESFSLVFDNSVTEGDWVWNTIVMRTAALQEVFTRWLRARSIILRTNEGREPGGYGRLWDVPSTFAANVRSIAEGNAIMQLTSRMSSVEIKATDLDLNSRMHYTFGDWDDEWNAGVGYLEWNTDFWRRLHPKYSIEPAGFKRVVTTVRRPVGGP